MFLPALQSAFGGALKTTASTNLPSLHHALTRFVQSRGMAQQVKGDVVIVGAGSVGTLAAMAMAEKGLKTIVVESRPTSGQGENKHAIGGVRATHGTPAKIVTCHRSLEIFRSWKEKFGFDMEYYEGGYLFPLYEEKHKKALEGLLPMQHKHKLEISLIEPEQCAKLVQGLNTDGLMGGMYSPKDASVSPLRASLGFHKRAVELGVDFHVMKKVTKTLESGGKVEGVEDSEGTQYLAPVVLDTTGGYDLAQPLLRSIGRKELPLCPDLHEAGITEPVKRFMEPMVVDLRERPGSKNFYFYQNLHGQVIFCVTPNPPILGTDHPSTSYFLPQVSKRLVEVIPRMKNLRVRRVWRGIYPMTPDGSPIVGWNKEVKGLLHATAMCGQGFMLGPGLGETLMRAVIAGPDSPPKESSSDETEAYDAIVFKEFSPYREFSGMEALK